MTEFVALLKPTTVRAAARAASILRRRWLLITSIALVTAFLGAIAPSRIDASVFLVAGGVPVYFFLLADSCRLIRPAYKMTAAQVWGVVGWAIIAGIAVACAAVPLYVLGLVPHLKVVTDIAIPLVLMYAGARFLFVFLLAALGVDDNPIGLSWVLSGGTIVIPLLIISAADSLFGIGIDKIRGALPPWLGLFAWQLLTSIVTALILALTAEWLPICRERLAGRRAFSAPSNPSTLPAR